MANTSTKNLARVDQQPLAHRRKQFSVGSCTFSYSGQLAQYLSLLSTNKQLALKYVLTNNMHLLPW